MAKCKHKTKNGRCGLKESYAYRKECYTEECCKCHEPIEPCSRHEPMTNADRIRAMSDEELAEFICGIFDDDEYFGKFINGRIIPCYDQHKIAEWLKQPSEEETQQDCTYNKNGHCIGQKLMPECDAKNCDRRK